MKNFHIFGLLFALIANIGFTQSNTGDSLKKVLQKPNLSSKDSILTLRRLLYYGNEALDSVEYYAKVLEHLAQKNNDKDALYSAHHNLAYVSKVKGKLELALEYNLKALREAPGLISKAGIYSNIANVYSLNKDFPNALENYLNGLKIFKQVGDSLRLGTTVISLGFCYYRMSQLDSAEYYERLAKEIFSNKSLENNEYYWAYATGNLALIKAKKGDFESSEKGLIESIRILQNYNDPYAICDYELELAEIYFEKGRIDMAVDKAHSTLEVARANGLKEFIRDGSELLSKFYSLQGNFEQAFFYQKEFMTYSDSLLNADLIRRLSEQEKEFEVGQKQAELDLVTAQQKTERVIMIGIACLALVLVVLAFIIFRYYRAKTRINKVLEEQKLQLESLNKTKDKFFSIISHDLRGPVNSFFGISRMIKYLVQSKETDQLLEIADDIDQSVERLSSLLDNLLSWAIQQQGEFPYNPEQVNVKELAEEIAGTFDNMAQGKKINLQYKVDAELAVYADKKMTQTIIRNLVNNALKFTPENGSVTISGAASDNQVHIQIKDTGVGMADDKLTNLFQLQDKKSTYGTSGEKGLGLGLQLVYEFIERNNGSVEVESVEAVGTTFYIKLPRFSV
ncbi:MAG: tetratricopeptide repeat-containing sensor histidine kinase [Cyclobacteriaceae bacterium]